MFSNHTSRTGAASRISRLSAHIEVRPWTAASASASHSSSPHSRARPSAIPACSGVAAHVLRHRSDRIPGSSTTRMRPPNISTAVITNPTHSTYRSHIASPHRPLSRAAAIRPVTTASPRIATAPNWRCGLMKSR